MSEILVHFSPSVGEGSGNLVIDIDRLKQIKVSLNFRSLLGGDL